MWRAGTPGARGLAPSAQIIGAAHTASIGLHPNVRDPPDVDWTILRSARWWPLAV